MSEGIDEKVSKFDSPRKGARTLRPLKSKTDRNINQPNSTKIEEKIYNRCINFLKNNKKILNAIVIIILVVIILLVLLYFFLLKKIKEKYINVNNEFDPEKSDQQVLKPIYTFNNKVGDLKRITVNQTSYETMTTSGQSTKFLIHRNTTYDIYIKSEEKSEEKNKNFYSTKYIAVMNIVKECFSTEGENCEPKNYMDLSSTQNKNNLRRLPEIDDLKDIPIPICLIEFTDNDAITSISCPETLSKNKKNQMTLDFYFFRPAAIEKPEMNNPLKTIKIEKIPIDNGNITRERNSGICNTKNAYKTHCTTDMNTTTDSNNNVMAYDEIAFSNFTTDENNSYVKTKKTHLKDITNQTQKFSSETYKKQLNNILEKLKPHLKKDELFSESDFNNIHSIIKGNTTKEKITNKRNLNGNYNGLNPYVRGESLFFKEINGVQIDFNLKNDIGIGTDSMKTNSFLFFDENEIGLSSKNEQSPINTLLEKLIILSKAGNNLANELYEQIKGKLDNITKDISSTISSLNDLIVYNDLVSIFDSSLSVEKINKLPSTIIKESQNLYDSLNNKLIDTTEITNYKNILNTNINNFLSDSHNLVNELLEQLKKLNYDIGSSKGQLTEIATYYLNNTSYSYTTILSKAENILKNYYINEKELISNEVNLILTSFEENIKNSIKKEIGIIENIQTKLENKNITIDSGSEDDRKNAYFNLYNSTIKLSDIISLYKSKINSSLDLKKNGYFINENDIKLVQKQTNDTIKQMSENSQKFDYDDLIDKKYDEIMSNFREDFIKIKNYMNNKRDEIFFMDDDVLKNTIQDETKKLSDKLNSLRSSTANEIINENNNIIDDINSKINNFISQKKGPLNQLIKNIDVLFSEQTLEKLSNLYEETFEKSFELIKKQINNNRNLSYEYLDYLYKILSNNNETIVYVDPFLKYKMGDKVFIWSNTHYTYVTNLDKYIRDKQLTNAYQTKYNIYSANFDSSEKYINNQMYIDLSYEYKNLIIKLKSLLQSVKNNKFSDKYGDLTELTFVDDNIRTIDNLYTRLDKYFSETLYNENYLKKFNTFKQNEIQEIEKIKLSLTQKNKLLTDNRTIVNDKTNDFCASYTNVVTHTCTNLNVFSLQESDYICSVLYSFSNNHNQLVTTSISSENNLEKLQIEFENFFSSLNQNINEYNNALTTLKNEIASLEINTINKEDQLISLNDINANILTFLDQKYGNNLIKESYDFYQKTSENKFLNFLNNTKEKWIESFKILQSEIKNNKNNFKNNVDGLFLMASIYKSRSSEMINNYTNSIINQQINEFNYTISYYYNCLYTLVNKTYQYIIGKIPVNRDGFNTILNTRKKQVIEKHNEIINKIKNSENNTINEKNQINLLEVSTTNFFKVNNILANSINEIQEKLGAIVSAIGRDLASAEREHTQYSISARLYLENSENGKIIQEISNSINDIDFFNLNQEKFKELVDNNIIFDQENLLNGVNSLISESNLETLAEYQRIREKNIIKLENEIKNYFTKESLIKKINTIYKKGINELDESLRNEILININTILEFIVKNMKDESDRLQITFSYNSNYETINQTIKNYKEEIFNKTKNEIVYLFETFNKNMYDKIYSNYLEKGLNEYLTEIKSVISNNQKFIEEYKTLGGSYKLGDDIDGIAEDLSNQYKYIGKEEIENIIRSDYYKKLNLEDIEQLINEAIESAFTSYLFPALKQYAKYDVNDTTYHSYDLSDDIKNNISLVIKENLLKIKDIMAETKGENYDFQLDYHEEWKILDFSGIGVLLGEIGEEFKKYINKEIKEEKEMFSNYFKNNINMNFNNMLFNFILSFGEKFFERISEYNLNNRIDNLFNCYRYSFTHTFFFDIFVLFDPDFSLLKDLKEKLIKINNIDLIIEQNKDMILKIIDKKIDNFIDDTSDYLVNEYISYMQQDDKTSEFQKLSNETKSLIKTNLIISRDNIKNNYKNTLNSYLKNPLIKKYELYLIEKINELIKRVNDFRESVLSQIKDVKVVDSEEILNEINKKINSTLEGIDNYNNHFNEFKISENIKQFLLSYGENFIKPLYENIINLINNATKNIIFENLDKNSYNYEKNLNISLFNSKVNESQSFLNESYINYINNQINLYDPENYVHKLENEKDKIKKRRRRYLENLNTEDDIKDDYSERVADKPLDDTFSKLLDTADSVQNYVDSLNEFNLYDRQIKNYINDINIAAKNSSQLIEMYDFEENTMNRVKDKLSYLQNISLIYYNKVNDSYFIIRNNIKNSIKKINDELKKCANATYETFANNYINILNNEDYKPINKTYLENEEELDLIQHRSTTQNGDITFKTKILNFRQYSGFKFDIQYEENKNIKKPKISASVTNKNLPKKITITTYEEFGDCLQIGKKIEIEFTDANYSTILNFDTKSTDIKLTSTTKLERYSYTITPFKDGYSNTTCKTIEGITICLDTVCIYGKPDTSEKKTTIVDTKEYNITEVLLY